MGWAHLDFIKELNVRQPQTAIRRAPGNGGDAKTVLYLFGDSYSYGLADSCFAGLAGYRPINRYVRQYIDPDPRWRNILVIEYGERFVRQYLGDQRIFDMLQDTVHAANRQGTNNAINNTPHSGFSVDSLFNKNINQNIQYNLFNYGFITPLFESKAALNYYLFGRSTSSDVIISKDNTHLFFAETTEPGSSGSSYAAISDDSIGRLVSNFNTIYDHYRSLGFAEVYLSILPSPATIVQPQGYNNMIPRLQHDRRLRMKMIDMYTPFKNAKEELYLRTDTHWNMTGKQMWVDTLNSIIARNNL